jgi:hypothetical protein
MVSKYNIKLVYLYNVNSQWMAQNNGVEAVNAPDPAHN